MKYYFNHAGTSWPKPDAVTQAVAQALAAPPEVWPSQFATAEKTVCNFFGITKPEGFLFTVGATAALGYALSGYNFEPGDRIVSSRLEHHALARQLVKLSLEKEVVYRLSPYKPELPFDLDFLRNELKQGGVKLVALSHGANVTGDILPVQKAIELSHSYDVPVLVDAAQTAGVLPINVGELGADIFVFAGHKGPRAPQGIGGLYIDPAIEMNTPAAVCEPPDSPGAQPVCGTKLGYCDTGSLNRADAVGLAAGLQDLEEQGWIRLTNHRLELNRILYKGLQAIKGVVIYGNPAPEARTRTLSITIDGKTTAEAAAALNEAGFITGAGFFCSPWAHEALGTNLQGTLRLSYGPATTGGEIEELLGAVARVASAG